MVELSYNLIIPLNIKALTEAHCRVLADYMARTSTVEESNSDPENPMGEYAVTSGEPKATPAYAPEGQTEYGRGVAETIAREMVRRQEHVQGITNARTPAELHAPVVPTEAVVDPVPPPAEPPPNPPTNDPVEPPPPAAKERRRCTKEWEGSELVTAGISPATIASIESVVETRKDLKAAKALVEGCLSRFTRPVLTVLREEEGAELLKELALLESCDVIEPSADPRPPTPPQGLWPPDFPPLDTPVLSKFGEGRVVGLGTDALGKEQCVLVEMTTGESVGKQMRFYPRELQPAPAPETAPEPCTKVEDPGRCADCPDAAGCLPWKVYQNQQEAAQSAPARPPWLR